MKFEYPEFIGFVSRKMKCGIGLAFGVVCLLQFQVVQKFGHGALSLVMCICWFSMN